MSVYKDKEKSVIPNIEVVTDEEGFETHNLLCLICGEYVGQGEDEEDDGIIRYNQFYRYCPNCGQRLNLFKGTEKEGKDEEMTLKQAYKAVKNMNDGDDRNLKKMSFGEALWHYLNEPQISSIDVKSCLSGRLFDCICKSITKEEYMDLWTVEGVYEDD